jgi:hypothetical protein
MTTKEPISCSSVDLSADRGGSDIAENETATTEPLTATGNGKTKRVSSVGARLPEPEPPVTEAAEAPNSIPLAIPSATPEESPISAPPEKIEEAPKTAATSPPRTRRPAGRRTITPAPVKPKPVETTAVEETAKTEESGEATEPAKPKTGYQNHNEAWFNNSEPDS